MWYPAPFTVDGISYGTAERWMMAGKEHLFKDEDEAAPLDQIRGIGLGQDIPRHAIPNSGVGIIWLGLR